MSDEQPESIHNTGLGRGPDGRFYLPAADVTTLLRGYARAWTDHAVQVEEGRAPEGEAELDPGTLRALASVLERQADDMDVQLIAHRSEDESEPPA